VERLVADADLRRAFGEAGRARVRQQYEWTHSVDEMLACFNAVRARFQSSPHRPPA
jgi:glycosyltransferase involved in cell wall biosynthesis